MMLLGPQNKLYALQKSCDCPIRFGTQGQTRERVSNNIPRKYKIKALVRQFSITKSVICTVRVRYCRYSEKQMSRNRHECAFMRPCILSFQVSFEHRKKPFCGLSRFLMFSTQNRSWRRKRRSLNKNIYYNKLLTYVTSYPHWRKRKKIKTAQHESTCQRITLHAWHRPHMPKFAPGLSFERNSVLSRW